MEKSNNVFVYPSEFGWSDLGTWGSLSNHLDSDEKNNFLLSKNILTYDSKNNIIRTEDDKMCIVNGLEGYIVIETQNALLICKKDEEQKIKQFVSDIKFNIDDKFI